jgi:hypothetical protein
MENNNAIADYALELAKKHSKQEQTENKTNEQNAQSQEKVEPKNEKLDNGQNNSYIKENQNDDPDIRLFQETFGGDPKKLAEAYRNSQREFTKINGSLKEIEKYKQTVQQLDEVYERDPLIKELLDAASKGETAENYLKTRLKLGETNKSVGASNNSKLGSGLASADENSLSAAGYLDVSKKTQYTAMEWQNEVLKAQLTYATNEVPRLALEKTLAELEQREQRTKETQEKQTVLNQNKQRFESQFNEALKAGYDFAGEHKDLYERAVEESRFVLDPKNPKLIREDAFLMTLNAIAARENKVPKRQQMQMQQQNQPLNYNGKNIFSGGKAPQPKLEGLAGLRSALGNRNQQQLDARSKLFKS